MKPQNNGAQFFKHPEEHLSNFYKAGLKRAKSLEGNLKTEIKKNPVRSLLIAAGVGLLLGAVWRRR